MTDEPVEPETDELAGKQAVSSNHGFPVFLDLRGRQVILVGGGRCAAGKASRLHGHGAQLVVIAPDVNPDMARMITERRAVHQQRSWQASDFKPGTLVVIASEDRQSNAEAGAAAHSGGCWVNVANQPAISSFLIPSLIDRSPLLVAVSSGGTSPILARLLTARIDAFLPTTYRALGQLAKRYRSRIATHISNRRQRRRFWENVLDGRVGELILQGRTDQVEQALEQAIIDHEVNGQAGEVYLVGAGPGDPDLLSFRALRLMQQCDVVLYDRLVSEPIMALVTDKARRIYVGKKRNEHAVPQESINSMLVSQARNGNRVLRLKGGDPFIFGRGGEEIESLASEGIAFQVIPGITAAAGCASYAGIPLTHRDHAQSCLFVTGHLKDGSVNLDWQALTRAQQTVVIYMGLVGLPVICEQLIAHGLPPTHPIAIIAQGTLDRQRVVSGTLSTLPALVQAEAIKPPTLIIVGEVVSLRDKLAWFEKRHQRA